MISTGGGVVIIVGVVGLMLGYFLPRLEVLYREIGIRLPQLTQWVMVPWTHVIAGVLLLGVIAWRHQQSWRKWLTHAAALVFAIYLVFTVTGLLLPLLKLKEPG